MIAHVRGQVVHRGPATVVVDVHGVGYLVHVASAEGIPPRGQPVELHTSLQVREDSMTLYGFPDRAALELFELLLTSSGVGPRLALAALATHRPDVLRSALAGADLATLTAIPGVGRKVAERLVLELKDKVGGTPALSDLSTAGGSAADGGLVADARDALLALGYSAGEVAQALAAADPTVVTEPGELVRQCLRHLGAVAFEGARA